MKKFFAVYLPPFQVQESRNGNGVKALSPHLWIFVWILIHKMQILRGCGDNWMQELRPGAFCGVFSVTTQFSISPSWRSDQCRIKHTATRGLTPASIPCSWCWGCSPRVPSLWSEVAWNLTHLSLVPCFGVGSASAKDLKPRQSHMLTLFLTLGGIWICNPWTRHSRIFPPVLTLYDRLI